MTWRETFWICAIYLAVMMVVAAVNKYIVHLPGFPDFREKGR